MLGESDEKGGKSFAHRMMVSLALLAHVSSKQTLSLSV